MEEVDSNHLPEFIKDIIVEQLLTCKYQWIELCYNILQKDFGRLACPFLTV